VKYVWVTALLIFSVLAYAAAVRGSWLGWALGVVASTGCYVLMEREIRRRPHSGDPRSNGRR
jgi:hypothetical protein